MELLLGGITISLLIILYFMRIKKDELEKSLYSVQTEYIELDVEKKNLESKLQFYDNLTTSNRVYQYSLLKQIVERLPEPRQAILDYEKGIRILFKFRTEPTPNYSSDLIGDSQLITIEEFTCRISRYLIGATFEHTLIIEKGSLPVMAIPITKTQGDTIIFVYNFPKFMIIGDSDFMIKEAMQIGFNSIFNE